MTSRFFLVMGPSLGSARARPAFFGGLRLDILRRAKAQAGLFEKGPENWSFHRVKIRGSSRLDFFKRA